MDPFYSPPVTGSHTRMVVRMVVRVVVTRVVTYYHSISVLMVRNTDGKECWCIGNFAKLDLPILGDPGNSGNGRIDDPVDGWKGDACDAH